MRGVLKSLCVVGLLSLLAGCDGSPPDGSGESGDYEISNVEVEELDSGVYEVTVDAQWEGELSVQESRCIVQVMGRNSTLLGKGRKRISDSGTGLTVVVRGDEGTPERADVLCPEVAEIPLDE